MKVNILMTCAGGKLSPEMYKQVKATSCYDITIISTDTNPEAIGQYFSDYFYQLPMPNIESYSKDLSDICMRHNVDILIPGSDEEVFALSKNRHLFNCFLSIPPEGMMDILTDKSMVYDFIKERGCNVPEYSVLSNEKSAAHVIDEYCSKYNSFIVKPVSGRGSRDVYIVHKELRGLISTAGREKNVPIDSFLVDCLPSLAEKYPLLVMERLSDPVYDVDVISWDGEVKQAVVRRRICSQDPNSGHIIVKDNRIVDYVMKISALFNLSGIYDFDIMLNGKNEVFLLEINPRLSGSLSVTMRSGVNLIESLVTLVLHNEFSGKHRIPYGKKVLPYSALEIV